MNRPKRRGTRIRAAVIGAAAALVTMAVGVSSAQAVPFKAEMDNAFLKTGAFPNPGLDILEVPPDPLWSISGELTPGVPPAPSTFTVQPAGFDFPAFSGTVLGGAVGVEVALVALEPVNGTVDGTTGAVTTTEADFEATLTLDFTPADPADPKDVCAIAPVPMAFNTAQPFPAPYAGDPFTVDLPNLATDALDNGALSATWPTLPAAVHESGPGDCGTVDALSGGRGGLWLASDLAAPTLNSPPPEPPPAATPPPAAKKKKCKKGQKLKKGKCVKKKKKKKKKKK